MVCAVLGLYTLSSVGSGVCRVEAVSNTSAVAQCVVGDDEKESLESEYPRLTVLARTSSSCKRQTHPLV
jgi:hypothetical protein